MAKKTNCVFCNKELTKGLFKGDDCLLDTGAGLLTCCEDCYSQYQADEKRRSKRFGIKVENLKRAAKRKVSEKELAEMYRVYVEEEQRQFEKCGRQAVDNHMIWFGFNNRKFFAVKEQATGFINSDVTAKEISKSIKKSEDYDSLCFDSDDITKLEFRPVGTGSSLKGFSKMYSYEIRLNDEKVLTYKPCIARTFAIGTGLFPRKKAEELMYTELKLFKERIGSTLPITKVKKFV